MEHGRKLGKKASGPGGTQDHVAQVALSYRAPSSHQHHDRRLHRSGGPQKTSGRNCWEEFLSSLKLTLTAVDGLCYGALVALLALGKAGVEGVALTISTGLWFGPPVVGAIVASHQARKATT